MLLLHTTCDILFATCYLLHSGTGTGTNVALEGLGCAAWCSVLGLGAYSIQFILFIVPLGSSFFLFAE